MSSAFDCCIIIKPLMNIKCCICIASLKETTQATCVSNHLHNIQNNPFKCKEQYYHSYLDSTRCVPPLRAHTMFPSRTKVLFFKLKTRAGYNQGLNAALSQSVVCKHFQRTTSLVVCGFYHQMQIAQLKRSGTDSQSL